MRGGPVDALAAAAQRELFLGGKHIGRDFLFDGFFSDGFQRSIALDAAGEEIFRRIQTTVPNNLLELIAEMVALDQEIRWGF